MKLIWHGYRYYPYERALAMREIAALLPASMPREVPGGLELPSSCSRRLANRLTYVSRIDGERGLSETQQSCLEMTARKGKARQATRYSVRELVAHMFDQGWNVSQPKLGSPSPAWQLGTDEAKGTQYFWLSKDCYDFFPPLTILNRRGHKRTYSSKVRVYFADLPRTSTVRVTFEAENNLDFRLGTGPLRGTGLAAPGIGPLCLASERVATNCASTGKAIR